MTIETIAVPMISAILSIGAVSAFVARYVTKVVKYTRIASDALKLVEDAVECLQDGKIDEAEVVRIVDDATKLKADLKA